MLRACTICGTLTPNTRCPEHQRNWPHTTSAAARGYDHAWRKLRARTLRRHPTCQHCNTRPSTTVDHIIPLAQGGARLNPHNVQALCNPCRQEKDLADNHTKRSTA
jgi:5-methylcytosine-specific restriction enzyme A